MENYDTDQDTEMTLDEWNQMFDAETDFFFINWPSKGSKYFDECNIDDNDFLEGQEIADCYLLNCNRECTVSDTVSQSDIDIKNWCGCLYHTEQTVLDQWDTTDEAGNPNPDGKL